MKHETPDQQRAVAHYLVVCLRCTKKKTMTQSTCDDQICPRGCLDIHKRGLLLTFLVLNSILKSLFSFWERRLPKMADFPSLGLSDWLVKQCKQLGIHKPTPVQLNCVPAILQGKYESWLAHVNVQNHDVALIFCEQLTCECVCKNT